MLLFKVSTTYPEREDVLIVGLVGVPAWVLASLVGWD